MKEWAYFARAWIGPISKKQATIFRMWQSKIERETSYIKNPGDTQCFKTYLRNEHIIYEIYVLLNNLFSNFYYSYW